MKNIRCCSILILSIFLSIQSLSLVAKSPCRSCEKFSCCPPKIGPPGPPGSRGADGAAGPQGLTGDPGATGAQGAVGATGPQGLTGDLGATGDQGAAGIQGPQGDTGAQGAIGDQGAVGQQGLEGAQGPPGGLSDFGYVYLEFPNATDTQVVVDYTDVAAGTQWQQVNFRVQNTNPAFPPYTAQGSSYTFTTASLPSDYLGGNSLFVTGVQIQENGYYQISYSITDQETDRALALHDDQLGVPPLGLIDGSSIAEGVNNQSTTRSVVLRIGDIVDASTYHNIRLVNISGIGIPLTIQQRPAISFPVTVGTFMIKKLGDL